MSWKTELWDQNENLADYTQKGIEFLERYGCFIRDKCEIEMEYAKKLRQLVMDYQPKKKEEDEYEYSSYRSFKVMLSETNSMANQHQTVAKILYKNVFVQINNQVMDIKTARKKLFQESAKHISMINCQVMSLERSRKKYEKAFNDLKRYQGSIKQAGIKKYQKTMNIKNQYCEESKDEYINQLQKTNELQRLHYKVRMAEVLNQLQELDEKRIHQVRYFMIYSAEVELNAFSIISNCQDTILNVAIQINKDQDSILVIKKYKSGLEPPGDYQFNDLNNDLSCMYILENSNLSNVTYNTGQLFSFNTFKRSHSRKKDDYTYQNKHNNDIDNHNHSTINTCNFQPSITEVPLSRSSSVSSIDIPVIEITNRNSDETDSLNHSPSSFISYNDDPPQNYGSYDLLPLDTCTALYEFETKVEGYLSISQGDELLIIEQGNTWTRVRRKPPNTEEGLVPTLFITRYSS